MHCDITSSHLRKFHKNYIKIILSNLSNNIFIYNRNEESMLSSKADAVKKCGAVIAYKEISYKS